MDQENRKIRSTEYGEYEEGYDQKQKDCDLIADGVNGAQVEQNEKGIMEAGAVVELIAPKLGEIRTDKRCAIPVDKSLMTVSSVLYDAVYIPGGAKAIAPLEKPDAVDFISLANKHCKPIAFEAEAYPLIQKTNIGDDMRAKKSLAGICPEKKKICRRIS